MNRHLGAAIRMTYFSIGVSALLAIVKGVTGHYGHSYALVADAIESASDVATALLVLFGLRYSSRPPDYNHPYGHGKVEPLITFAVVMFLFFSATIIAYRSIENIQTPHEVPESYTLWVLAAVVLTKEIFYRIALRNSELTKSTSLKADAWHHRSDAITSLAAFVGISIAVWKGPGYESADDWAALLASVFIVYNAYLIFRPALGEILDENLYDEMIGEIRKVALTVDGVKGTDKCIVRKAGMIFHVDLHLIVSGDLPVRQGHVIAHRLKDVLQKEMPEIADVLIHVEPG